MTFVAIAEAANPGLHREAFKMATGSGKTVVMAMLIAWQTLNKRANPQDARFTEAFLIVTPGITVKDRLEVLKPNNPSNYYTERDIVPSWQREQLEQARIVITNYHSFLPREKIKVAKNTKGVLQGNKPPEPGLFTETPADVVRRVCQKDFGPRKSVIVLNDEAHHCYRANPAHDQPEPGADPDFREEVAERKKAAHAWLGGLMMVASRIGIKDGLRSLGHSLLPQWIRLR